MKLLSLNLWGARNKDLLFDFLKTHSNSTNIFCFQEVFDSTSQVADFKGMRPQLLQELKELLPEFNCIYVPSYDFWIDTEKVDFPVTEGQAIFVKKEHKIIEQGSFFIYGDERTQIQKDFINEPKKAVYLGLEKNGQELLVVNIHGKWYPGDKSDTPERIKQSEIINSFLNNYSCKKIVCGDFNLELNTQSVKLLETSMDNLISKFNITNTRNEVSWKMYGNKQYYADFTFVSKNLKVEKFEVPYNLVSDHLPMILEFNLN